MTGGTLGVGDALGVGVAVIIPSVDLASTTDHIGGRGALDLYLRLTLAGRVCDASRAGLTIMVLGSLRTGLTGGVLGGGTLAYTGFASIADSVCDAGSRTVSIIVPRAVYALKDVSVSVSFFRI